MKGLGQRLSEERLKMFFVIQVRIKKSLSRARASTASHNPDELVSLPQAISHHVASSHRGGRRQAGRSQAGGRRQGGERQEGRRAAAGRAELKEGGR